MTTPNKSQRVSFWDSTLTDLLGRRQNVSHFSGALAVTTTATRRRGAALEHAIFEATLAELSEFGYNALVIDRVARRARLGRASIYRRWTTKRDLVADAIAYSLPASGTTTRNRERPH